MQKDVVNDIQNDDKKPMLSKLQKRRYKNDAMLKMILLIRRCLYYVVSQILMTLSTRHYLNDVKWRFQCDVIKPTLSNRRPKRHQNDAESISLIEA